MSERGILLADAASINEALFWIHQHGTARTDLFLMDDAVTLNRDERLRSLRQDGCDICLCAQDAERFGVVPEEGGPRFGSQYDHARIVATSGHLLALTGTRREEKQLGRGPRAIAVRLTRPPDHGKTAEGIRTAVGYALYRLPVTLLVDPEASPLLHHNEHPAEVVRALGTLRSLDIPVYETDGNSQSPFHVDIAW